MKEKVDRYALLIGRLLLGALFIYSGFIKLAKPIEYFEVAIAQYEIIGPAFTHAFALVMPWIELVFGTYLILGYRTRMSAGTLAALTALFQFVLAQALIRQLPVDECGCFGGGSFHLTIYQSFFVDTLLALWLVYIATSASGREKDFSLDRLLSPQ